jgi:hypothetical protein
MVQISAPQTTGVKEPDPFDTKQQHPDSPTTRDEFYHSFDNLRYFLKINCSVSQQARNVPIEIENLVSFHQEVLDLLDNRRDIGVTLDSYDHWTTKIQSSEELLEHTEWRDIESEIERLAKEENIALKKTICMSGRGYSDKEFRVVSVSYSFGSGGEWKEQVADERSSIARVEWVGGEFGRPADLEPPDFEITVKTSEPQSVIQRVKQFVPFI